MVNFKLTYFNMNMKGMAECIRMTLSYLGHDFEDNRIEREDWPELKKTIPFGKIPALEVDGQVVTQSSGICRYLAKGTDLAGRDAWEDLQIDMVVGAVYDLIGEVSTMLKMTNPKDKESMLNKLKKEIIPFYMTQFGERMDKNNGYLANGRLSWADIFLVGFAENLAKITVDPNALDPYPKLKALVDKVHSKPNIKKWIAKRP